MTTVLHINYKLLFNQEFYIDTKIKDAETILISIMSEIFDKFKELDQVIDFLMNETKGEGDYEDEEMIDEGRKKTGTPLCARGLASAKAKYDVFPSAYSNGHGVQVCKGKIKGLDGKRHCSGAYC